MATNSPANLRKSFGGFMRALLIGNRSDNLIEVWHGEENDLRERFQLECSNGDYRLLILTEDGEVICELRF